MVDGKVPSHPDLNIVAISNVNSTALLAQDHAAHVAGILGARMNNIDTRGVNPGAGVIAVRRGDSGGTPEALDWAFRDAELRGIYAVLNLSSNSSSYRSTGVVGPFIRRVSNRLLVVLAGGNADAVSQLDACSTTYELTNSLDGILVVGGVDQDGKRAETFNNSPSGYSSSTSGSKRGACIEAWAPSTSIASTWMTAPYTWQVLSGTSMAAPHVAALAARYGNSATTPVEREQYLRNILQPTGYSDGSGLPVVVPSYLFGPGAVRSRLTVYSVTADSSVPNYGPLFTIDKLYSDPNKVWNSGHTAPAWIEFDLGSPQVITSMRLAPEQSPNGPSVHNVYIGASPGPTSLITTMSQSNSATLEPLVASMNAYGRYVRILTTSSSSWVAWREIEIYGYNPSYP